MERENFYLVSKLPDDRVDLQEIALGYVHLIQHDHLPPKSCRNQPETPDKGRSRPKDKTVTVSAFIYGLQNNVSPFIKNKTFLRIKSS